MNNAQTQLFKKLIRDRIAHFMGVQRCVLGQPSMAAAPVRDVDIVVQMWAGVNIHIHVIDEPIKDGFGRLALGDTIWRIAGPDLAAGQKVRVVGSDGAVLKVEAA